VTAASMSALLELAVALAPYRDALVLIGGWTPFLLVRDLGRGGFRHVGSIDIDLAVDPGRVDVEGYASIVDIMTRRGYGQRRARDGQPVPSSFTKAITVVEGGAAQHVQVDFLTSAGPAQGAHRHRRVQSALPARVAEGCELAFAHNAPRRIEGVLPGDGEARAEVRAFDVTGCLAMKGIALGARYQEKDAYDIHSVIAHCLSGPEEVAAAVAPHMGEPAVGRGIGAIGERFRSIRAEGPSWVATFLHPTDRTAWERAAAAAYADVRAFLGALGLP
jgi:hypothetical protein